MFLKAFTAKFNVGTFSGSVVYDSLLFYVTHSTRP